MVEIAQLLIITTILDEKSKLITTHECDRQRDGQTDISRRLARIASRGKKIFYFMHNKLV